MTLPSITARQGPRCLYRAQNLPDLMVALLPYCGSQTLAWCLLWPGIAAKQFLLWKDNREMVEERLAEQIAQIEYPTHSQPFVPQDAPENGGARVMELLGSQFPFVADTQLMVVVHFQATPIAVFGLAGKVRPTYGKMVILEAVTALENLTVVESLQQEADMYRLLLGRHEESILIATEDGRIRGGTPAGLKALARAQHGERGASIKKSEQVIPEEIVTTVQAGEKQTWNGVSILGRAFGAAELVEDLTIYKFSEVTSTESVDFDEAAKSLTAAQREVLRLLVRGLHYKEIAARLGNSVHTIHHHVSALLKRLGCKDKLELIARFKGKSRIAAPRRKIFALSPMIEAPTMKDLPRPTKKCIEEEEKKTHVRGNGTT